MPRYFLELAYKGTAYSGFQVQDNANSIQAEVTKALDILFKQSFELTGSSRTDAGVHALQNYFHFDTDQILLQKHLYNLNALLPIDIVVKGIYRVPETAHCRFDAISREYWYHIYLTKDPFMLDRGWLYPYPLDISMLNQIAQVLKEYTDFTSFAKRNTQVKTFLCNIEESEWSRQGDNLVYRVKSNRFLRGMVRGMVGTMVKIAGNENRIEALRSIIEAKDCTKANFSTPPQGLFLQKIIYKSPLQEHLQIKLN
jgi:tRNA pseudouridine38-40 synthase